MPRKSGRNTKGRIVSAAWKLFYAHGYDNTTVEDIIFESETSKGSFYHYFEGKDATVSVELLARLFSTQLTTKGEKHLLSRDRTYFKLLHQVVRQGLERHELRGDLTANEIINDYAMFERGLMYDWCLSDGDYALARHADRLMPMFLRSYQGEK